MRKQKSKWCFRSCFLLIFSFFFVSIQAQIKVTGSILDASNEPLIGATIQEKGTSNGTMADIDGKFTINVQQANAILTFSYVGYETKEISLNGRTTLDVVLESSIDTKLDEVIVVGYGTQKKSSLTAAISQIDGKELIKAPSTNISQLIGGRIAGVTSVQESGQPGSDQAGLNIRGNTRGALYIVDGVRREINDIPPGDIATVSVLKDASAAAVYGLDGAGGVVIITTKSGQQGKPKLTYDGSFGISKNANYPEFLDGPSYAWYYNKGLELDGRQPVFTQQHVEDMLAQRNGWGNTNWIDEVYGTGHTQKHNISLSGGSDKTKYFASLAYMNQEGNIDQYQYQRYNMRANLESTITDGLQLVFSIAGMRGDRKSPAFAAGGGEGQGYGEGTEWMSIARQAVNMHPYLPIRAENGLYTASPNDLSQPSSPLAAIEQSGRHKSNNTQIQSNVSLIWDVPWVPGLTAKIAGYYDHANTTSKQLNLPYNVMLAKTPDSSSPELTYSQVQDVRNRTVITLLEGTNKTDNLTGQASLNYATQINKVHNIEAMALIELQDMKNNSFSVPVEGLDFPELPEISLGQISSTSSPVGTSRVSRNVGMVYRLRYDYMSKYLIEISGRYDGSHKFAGNVSGKRWGYFPAGSIGWRMSEENFIKDNIDFIDNLKIRGAIGLLGSSSAVGNESFNFLNTYTFNDGRPIIIGSSGNLATSMYPSSLANPDLTWEKTRTLNIGYDLSMWRGLLSMEFDFFYNYTYDILGAVGEDKPLSMGGHYPAVVNKNRYSVKGIDFMIGHDNRINLAGKAFDYGVKLNFTWSKGKWLRYDDSPNVPDYQKLVGKPLGAQDVFIADGLFKTEEEIDAAAWRANKRPRLGDIKYRDVNGDGIIDEQDRGWFGKSNRPNLTAGLNLYGSWNGFDFNVLFVGAAQFDVSLTSRYYNTYDDTTIFTRLFKSGGNSPRYLAEGAWRPDNPDGEYPRLSVNPPNNDNGWASTFWLKDGKYLRLKSAQVGYTIPRQLTNKIKMENVRIFLEGNNLFTWSGLPEGIDPEMPRVSNGYYPQQTTYMGGISVTF